ncbi:germination protein YpeB [Paenibacillus sp. IB182496]|uniref:Germination protein YpeB n=1 Tax=Paenibacillus sabuli TaxID=2772509 RepID=A0A927GRP3_9BACL|nr:germination protein YpeB [Paenibacillus sabuli]MBD2845190.1 germination protein YpeB [Paenibacillus sabuli]
MYQRLSAVLFPLIALLLVGSVYWGYQEHQEKNSILIKAENQYQRAFHELSHDMDVLHDQLGNTLAVNSSSQAYHRKGLVNVWRITSQAQSEINQLPLTLLPLNKTEDFLAHIASFSYKAAVRDLAKEPLTGDEQQTLKTLYARSAEISRDLQDMQNNVIANNLRWMDVEVALAAEQSAQDNTILDGFKTVDKKVEEYPEINWGPSVSAMFERRTIRMLEGGNAKPEDVQRAAAKFLELKDSSQIAVSENGKGTEYESYSASVAGPEGQSPIQLEYTKKGPELIWFMNARDIDVKAVSADEAERKAQAFLKARGYPDMKAISYDPHGNVGNFTFVAKQGDVLIYPEKLVVKSALDNGEPVGLQAGDYVYEHRQRKLDKPKLSVAEARKTLNPDFKVKDTEQALIKNELSKEVLCYEFTGKINDSHYRIYVNASDGNEEMIERLPGMNGDGGQ